MIARDRARAPARGRGRAAAVRPSIRDAGDVARARTTGVALTGTARVGSRVVGRGRRVTSATPPRASRSDRSRTIVSGVWSCFSTCASLRPVSLRNSAPAGEVEQREEIQEDDGTTAPTIDPEVACAGSGACRAQELELAQEHRSRTSSRTIAARKALLAIIGRPGRRGSR